MNTSAASCRIKELETPCMYSTGSQKEVNKYRKRCFAALLITKAFDRVQHNILFEILSDLDVNDKDIRLLHNLYFGQKANIRVCNTKSENVDIKKGVRQGCVASPDLFSLYSEVIMRAIDRENGVNIGGHNITNIHFADDTVLTANTADDLQILLEKTNAKCKVWNGDKYEKRSSWY